MDLNNRPRRFELRDRTSQAHAELDAVVGEWATVENYKHYLARYAAFRVPLERAIQEFGYAEVFGGWSPKLIALDIEQDLRDFAIDSIEQVEAPTIRTVSEALGVAYVIEGSSLGAKLLAGRAAELGLTRDRGARHLAVQSEILSWREFLAALEVSQEFDIEQAAVAADATFAMALNAFGKEKR